jgi:hypothetical protein
MGLKIYIGTAAQIEACFAGTNPTADFTRFRNPGQPFRFVSDRATGGNLGDSFGSELELLDPFGTMPTVEPQARITIFDDLEPNNILFGGVILSTERRVLGAENNGALRYATVVEARGYQFEADAVGIEEQPLVNVNAGTFIRFLTQKYTTLDIGEIDELNSPRIDFIRLGNYRRFSDVGREVAALWPGAEFIIGNGRSNGVVFFRQAQASNAPLILDTANLNKWSQGGATIRKDYGKLFNIVRLPYYREQMREPDLHVQSTTADPAFLKTSVVLAGQPTNVEESLLVGDDFADGALSSQFLEADKTNPNPPTGFNGAAGFLLEGSLNGVPGLHLLPDGAASWGDIGRVTNPAEVEPFTGEERQTVFAKEIVVNSLGDAVVMGIAEASSVLQPLIDGSGRNNLYVANATGIAGGVSLLVNGETASVASVSPGVPMVPTSSSDWLLNEAAGNVTDQRGIVDLVPYGSGTLTGNAYTMAPNASFLEAQNNQYWNVNSFTFGMCFSLASTTGTPDPDTATPANTSWLIRYDQPNGRFQALVSDGVAFTTLNAPMALAENQRYWALLSYQRVGGAANNVATLRIFVENTSVPVAQATSSAAVLMQKNPGWALKLGANVLGPVAYRLSLFRALFWAETVLSADECAVVGACLESHPSNWPTADKIALTAPLTIEPVGTVRNNPLTLAAIRFGVLFKANGDLRAMINGVETAFATPRTYTTATYSLRLSMQCFETTVTGSPSATGCTLASAANFTTGDVVEIYTRGSRTVPERRVITKSGSVITYAGTTYTPKANYRVRTLPKMVLQIKGGAYGDINGRDWTTIYTAPNTWQTDADTAPDAHAVILALQKTLAATISLFYVKNPVGVTANIGSRYLHLGTQEVETSEPDIDAIVRKVGSHYQLDFFPDTKALWASGTTLELRYKERWRVELESKDSGSMVAVATLRGQTLSEGTETELVRKGGRVLDTVQLLPNPLTDAEALTQSAAILDAVKDPAVTVQIKTDSYRDGICQAGQTLRSAIADIPNLQINRVELAEMGTVDDNGRALFEQTILAGTVDRLTDVLLTREIKNGSRLVIDDGVSDDSFTKIGKSNFSEVATTADPFSDSTCSTPTRRVFNGTSFTKMGCLQIA